MHKSETDALTHYPFNSRLGRSLSGGSVSGVWAVESDRGELVLKQYPDFFSPKDVVFIHQFTNYLTGQNFPTPEIVSNKAGDSLTVTGSPDRLFAVFEFISGKRFDIKNADHVRKAGTLLGLLHTLSGNYRSDIKRDWWTILTYPADTYFQEVEGQLGGKDGDKKLLQTCKLAWQEVNNNLHKDSYGQGRQQLVVHGDFRPVNLVYGNHQTWAIDFDNCRWEFKEMDFARGLRFFCGLPDISGWERRTDTFMQNYLQLIPKSDLGLNLALACILAQPLKEAMWQFRSYTASGRKDSHRNLLREISYLQSVMSHREEITRVLSNFFS